MAKRSLDSLVAERAALASELRNTRVELARAKAAVQSAARHWRLHASERNATLVIFSLSNFELEPAVRFLVTVGRRRRWPDKTPEELKRMVEDLFSSTGTDDVLALIDAEASSDADAMRTARPFVEEWRLVAWARRLNVEKGVAPTASAVLVELEAGRRRDGHPSPGSRGTAAQSSARMYVSRWVRRWGGSYGRIPMREEVEPSDLRVKAFTHDP